MSSGSSEAIEPREVTSHLRALFNRAIDDPASITTAEKNEIRLLPPPDEEDRVIRETLPSNSRAELVAKAVTAPETLSREEEQFLKPEYWKRNKFMSQEDRELMYKAIDATTLSDEQTAQANAYKREFQRHKVERAEKERIFQLRDHLRNLPRAEWVQRMVDADIQRWGFVCFRTAYGAEKAGDERWELFKTYYATTGKHVSQIWKGFRDLWPKHTTHFVSDPALDGCSTEQLRERFRDMRAAGEIPDGLRTDVFLAADEQAIADDCVGSDKPYTTVPCTMNVFGTNMYRVRIPAPLLRAIDPDHDPATVPTEGPYAGFKGEISYRLPKTFDWLHYTFFAESETWLHRYWYTENIEWAPFRIPHAPYPGYGPGFFQHNQPGRQP